MTAAVDPDDLSTWPAALMEALTDALDRCPATEYAADLAIPLSEERLATLFEGRPLRVYHATRLLEHEVLSIRQEGLHAVDAHQVENRIRVAVNTGAITAADADLIRRSTSYAVPRLGSWEGRVCSLVGRTSVVDDPLGVGPLLSCWGGEAIYKPAPPTTKQLLQRLGAPALVVIDLPTDAKALWFPPLARVLAGHLAGVPNRRGEVHFLDSVPASSIFAIWQPGDPEYDRLPGLPAEHRSP